jgi:hypothetical protein
MLKLLQAPPIEPLDHNQLSLDDLDAIKVIGKGSSGIVQLVRHKWTGQFFALKVLYESTFFAFYDFFHSPLTSFNYNLFSVPNSYSFM